MLVSAKVVAIFNDVFFIFLFGVGYFSLRKGSSRVMNCCRGLSKDIRIPSPKYEEGIFKTCAKILKLGISRQGTRTLLA